MDRAELDYRWMSRQPVEGVAFLLNDSVRVMSGPNAGASGAVIAIEQLEPQVTYRVELGDGSEAKVAESDLLTANADDPGAALAQLQRWYSSQCDGDCNEDGTVTVSELIQGVARALSDESDLACAAVDADGNDSVSVDELVRAVNRALAGCAPGGS